MKPKRVLIVGMYGAGNIGDDLILESGIDIVKKQYSSCKISIVSFSPKFHSNKFKLKTYSPSFIGRIKAIFNNDSILIAGGTALQDCNSWKFISGHIQWYCWYILLGKILSKEVILWSVGCDKLSRTTSKIWVRLVGIADKIILRDEKSLNNISRFISRSKLEVRHDLAYIYNKKSGSTIFNQIYQSSLNFKEVYFINIMNEENACLDYLEYLKKLIEEKGTISL